MPRSSKFLGLIVPILLLFSGCGKGLDTDWYHLGFKNGGNSRPYLFLLSETSGAIIRHEIDSNGMLGSPYAYPLPEGAGMTDSALAALPFGSMLFYSTGSSKTVRIVGISMYDGHLMGPLATFNLTQPPRLYSLALNPRVPCGYVGVNYATHPFATFCYDQSSNSFNFQDENSPTLAANGALQAPLVVHPSGNQMYIALGANFMRLPINSDGKSFGTVSSLVPQNTNAIAVSPDGSWLYSFDSTPMLEWWPLNLADGSNFTGGAKGTASVRWLTHHPYTNAIYVLYGASIEMYHDGAVSGAAAQTLTISGYEADPKTMVIAPDGKTLYVSGFNGNQILRFSINPSDQTLTYAGSTGETVGIQPNQMVIVTAPLFY
jgi:hypothetical protein